VSGRYNGGPGGNVISKVFVALAFGLLLGGLAWRLDRRFSPLFAETAGAQPNEVTSGTLIATYLIVSTPLALILLTIREGIGSLFVYRAVVVAILLWIASIDWRWRIIPNRIVYPSSGVALMLSPLAQPGALIHAYEFALLGFIVAGSIFLLFFLLGILIYRHADAFGLGDVKLAAFVGVALGYPAAAAAVILATFAGAVLALGWWIAYRSRKVGFPYGPAIVAGAILAMLVAPTGTAP
jgi:prepilin signal peptidase PulO-like enzyme (type II secretory pathway)